MSAADVKNDPVLQALVGGVKEALGTRLRSVVLYGSGARGDYHRGTSDLNLIVGLEMLDPRTLGALGLVPRVRRPVPRRPAPDGAAGPAGQPGRGGGVLRRGGPGTRSLRGGGAAPERREDGAGSQDDLRALL